MKIRFLLAATAICLSLDSNSGVAASQSRVSSQRLSALSESAFGAIWLDSDLEATDLEWEVRAALDAGVSPNARNEMGETLLLQAIDNQRVSIVRLLLRRGANPNLAITGPESARSVGETPLMRVIALDDSLFSSPKDRLQIALWLLQRGAKINQADTAGNTALIMAANSGQSDAVALLLKRGADVQKRNSKGQSALQIASAAIPRGSFRIMGAFPLLQGALSPEDRQRALVEQQKQDEWVARQWEARVAAGRKAVVRSLRAAGAKL